MSIGRRAYYPEHIPAPVPHHAPLHQQPMGVHAEHMPAPVPHPASFPERPLHMHAEPMAGLPMPPRVNVRHDVARLQNEAWEERNIRAELIGMEDVDELVREIEMRGFSTQTARRALWMTKAEWLEYALTWCSGYAERMEASGA